MQLRRLVVPLATALLLGAGAGAADARELRLVDGRGDMWASAQAGAAQPAPASSLGDIRRTKISYHDNRILVRLAFVDLAKRGSYAQYALVVQGHRDRVRREVVIAASPRHWSGRARVYKPRGDLVASCPVAHRIDYDRNIVRVRISRDCLHRPGSVRVNVNTTRADSSATFYSDNPHDDRPTSDAWSDWVRRTR